MDVLLIGGTRFVGYLLAWRLLAAGHRVTLLNRGTLPDPFGDRVARIQVDRRTPEFAAAVRGRRFDAVVDFAAYDGAEVRAAAQAFAGSVGHYVLVSTGQVYLVRQGCPSPAREEDYDGPVMPRPAHHHDEGEWAYGVGKRACEDALTNAAVAAALPATRVRIPVVHGERDYHRRIECYLWRLLDGAGVIVPDGGDRPLRHVYGSDVAAGIAAMLGERATFGRAFNLAQRETPTLAQLLARLAALLGAPARLVPAASDALRAEGLDPAAVSPLSSRWMSFLDPGRAERELGFAHTPLDEYLGRIVASFVAYPPEVPPETYTANRAAERALLGA